MVPPGRRTLFYLHGMVPANVDLPVIYRGVAPFIAPQLIGLAILSIRTGWRPAAAQAHGR